jgi:predicted transcriptional regulator
MNKITKKLIEAGLSDKEAAVYYAALTLGPTTILKISKATGLKRATIYGVIDDLVRQALMRVDEAGIKKVFVAESPKNLLRIAEQKILSVEEVVPDLEVLFKKQGKQRIIKTYEGLAAMQSIVDRFISDAKSGDFRYGIGGGLGWHDIDPKRQEKYFKWRERISLDTRFIFEESERAELHKSKTLLLKNKVRTLPTHMKLSADITITPRLMVIMKLFEPMSAVVIEDEDIINSYKELFLFMWEMLPE